MTKEEFDRRISEIIECQIYQVHDAIDQLRADIEAERGVVVDWSEAPEWADTVVVAFCKGSDQLEGEAKRVFFTHIPRPAPKYRPSTGKEKMDALLIAYREVNGFSRDQAMYRFAVNMAEGATIDDLCKAAGIETRVLQ